MAKASNCPTSRAGPMTRPRWEGGTYLTANACAMEQNYRLQRLRRQNRQLHASGIICGLFVVPSGDGAHPWAVNICPGFAIGPYGDEIEIPDSVSVNIEDFLWSGPGQAAQFIFRRRLTAYIAVRYQDFHDEVTPAPAAVCGCPQPEYRYARTGDGYQAGVLWTLPSAGAPAVMCQPGSANCPPCPESPWLILAAVALPPNRTPLTAEMIENGIRKTL